LTFEVTLLDHSPKSVAEMATSDHVLIDLILDGEILSISEILLEGFQIETLFMIVVGRSLTMKQAIELHLATAMALEKKLLDVLSRGRGWEGPLEEAPFRTDR
jgi:hypothetical protein